MAFLLGRGVLSTTAQSHESIMVAFRSHTPSSPADRICIPMATRTQ
jgi:hypothetical protein